MKIEIIKSLIYPENIPLSQKLKSPISNSSDILSKTMITKDNISFCLETLLIYLKQLNNTELTDICLELMENLFELVYYLFDFHQNQDKNTNDYLLKVENGLFFYITTYLTKNLVWNEYWKPILQIIIFFWKDKRNELKNTSMLIMKIIANNSMLNILNSNQWLSIFQMVIIVKIQKINLIL